MRPRERRDSGGQDLFRARLDQIIDLNHELAKLARAIDWRPGREFRRGVHASQERAPRTANISTAATATPTMRSSPQSATTSASILAALCATLPAHPAPAAA
jgi:hypothetical protein